MARSPLSRIVSASVPALALIGLLAASGCGPKVPTHAGYKKAKPWKKAKSTTFDEANEAEIDGKVSWAKKRRARWYALEVSEFGDLAVTMRAEQIGTSEEEFDLAFEILAPNGKVLVIADKEEDDAGEESKERKVAELEPGTYWIHVYLQHRMEAASFNLRLKFEPGAAPDESTFPSEVAFIEALAAVPPVDDAPPPVIVRKKCRGKKCKRVVKPVVEQPKKSIKARLVGVSAKGGRVHITIGVGSKQGVTKGASGRVVSSSGKGIQGGSFKVTRVTASKSWASVKASLDAVNNAKYARINKQ